MQGWNQPRKYDADDNSPQYMGVALLVNGFEVASIIRKRQDIKK